jgi:predicted metal-binding protein
MQVHPAPVSTALILVCEKCGRRLDPEAKKNPSRRLLGRLKKAAKEAFPKGSVRPVITSCMDICPEGRISVAIAPVNGSATRFFTVKGDNPESEAQRLVEVLQHEARDCSPAPRAAARTTGRADR